MTDIRARIAGALCNRLADLDVSGCRYVADNLTETLLALDGVAIVDTALESWPNDFGVSFECCDVMATKTGRVLVGHDLDVSPDYARDLAAALLAAAVQAQEDR